MTGIFAPAPVVVSHRGNGRGVAPDGVRENSAAAFEAALRHGVRWLEVDVRRTADDGLCVLHHATTEDGAFVAELSLAEVRGRGVLVLDDLLGPLPEGIGVVLDVKTSLEDALRPPERTTAGLLAPVAARLARRRPVLATSFDPAAALVLRGVPGLARGLTTWVGFPLRKAIPAAVHLGLDVVCAHWRSFLPPPEDPAPLHREAAFAVDVAHRGGLQVAAWCPDVERSRLLLDAGVDAVVMDDVPGGLALLAGRNDPGAPIMIR